MSLPFGSARRQAPFLTANYKSAAVAQREATRGTTSTGTTGATSLDQPAENPR
jgi:hypothetical protein